MFSLELRPLLYSSLFLLDALFIIFSSGGLRTTLPAQLAMPGPPLGTQLGQLGANIANFVKDFNLKTSIFRWGYTFKGHLFIYFVRIYCIYFVRI